MILTAILVAATTFSLTASFAAFAQEDTAAAGVSREEVIAIDANIVGASITYPTGAAMVTAEMITFTPEGRTAASPPGSQLRICPRRGT